MWLGDAFHEGPKSDPAHLHALVETASRMSALEDTDLALNLLLTAAFRGYRAGIGEDLSRDILRAADQVAVPAADPRLVQIQACTGRSNGPRLFSATCRPLALVRTPTACIFSVRRLARWAISASRRRCLGHRRHGCASRAV